jgi:hypothetical protein
MSRIDEELGERIRRATPPAVEAPLAKLRLKRELLSRHAAGTSRRLRLRTARLVGAAFLLGALGLLAFISLVPQKMTAQEMLSGLEYRYRQGFPPDTTHYVRSELKTASNPGPPLCIETWMAAGDKVRIKASREGKTLGHVLRAGGERFTLPGRSALELRVEIRGGDGQAAAGGKKVLRNVWLLPATDGASGKDGLSRARIIVAQGEMDLLGFACQSPADIYERLRKSPRTEYVGEETISGKAEILKVFRKRSSSELRCYTIEYNPLDRGSLGSFIRGLPAEARDAEGQERGRIRIRRSPRGEPFIVGETEIEERIKIGRESGRISGIEFLLSWNGETIERYQLAYITEGFGEFMPEDFDPALLGLVR